ncbi:SDR family NAD(P)-dependent oxidoreductase [Sinomicrobium weinanense]|uniref:SDR family oxidoreductase n=1 Tax=Sinomicrobium weinanense TaxID=2842200 RepID=A0A926JUR4_9FLAO|nr:SDR family oxidoreductase [Sinomicrobium weinanense]MBC9797556.1 SDR family oxidoreductase [Sinomicrobium weinanense]MBU3123911.1 SDR family oxidoreductase [Sinomicrobium weinanense]
MDRRSFIGKSLSATVAAGFPAGMAAAIPGKKNKGTGHDASRRERFRDKVVIITGATSGIGKAAALAFAREGARVGFCGRREKLGAEVEATIREQGGEATYVRADVTKPEEVESFVNDIAEKYGGLDVAFNNAGEVTFGKLHEITLEEWEWIHQTNIRGVFLAMKYQIPHMLKNGKGNIVLTASMHTVSSRPGGAAYASSKRGLMGLAQTAAMDYGQEGIRVNVLSPGITDTPMFRRSTGASQEKVEQARVLVDGLKRIATAEEMAEAALFLASDDCSYITGTSLLVDGGMMAGL